MILPIMQLAMSNHWRWQSFQEHRSEF